MSRRSSVFRWSASAWFGSQLGATVWMLLLGGVLLVPAPGPAATALVAFVLCNAAGLALWSQRRRVAAYPAIQILIVVTGLASLVVFGSVSRSLAAGTPMPGVIPAGGMPYWLLLIFPLLMIQFWLKARQDAEDAENPESNGEKRQSA